jgi:hypothetical protein
MSRTTEDAWALLRAAQHIHAERHGSQTFTPGTYVPLEAAAQRMGISPDRFRYYDVPSRSWSTRQLSSGTRVRDTPGETRTTSSPSVAWTCCVNPGGARAPRKFKLVGR